MTPISLSALRAAAEKAQTGNTTDSWNFIVEARPATIKALVDAIEEMRDKAPVDRYWIDAILAKHGLAK